MKRFGKVIFLLLGIGALIGVNWALFSGIVLGIPDEVKHALISNEKVQVENWEDKESYLFSPTAEDPITGLILYPEGRLDVRLYAPLAQMIAEKGYLVVFLARRFEREYDYAAEARRMENVIAAHPMIEHWVVGGLTWSSVLPVDFALKNSGRVDGVILLASRLNDTTSMAKSDLPVLYIYGTRDDENEDLLNMQFPYLPEQTVYGKIVGGNRLQYGYTGPMARDVGADISVEEQQSAAASHMIAFLETIIK
ncbi:MAG: alpha/beta hydrolase [Chloroflexota bacterium]